MHDLRKNMPEDRLSLEELVRLGEMVKAWTRHGQLTTPKIVYYGSIGDGNISVEISSDVDFSTKPPTIFIT